jgi:hypothetical protein
MWLLFGNENQIGAGGLSGGKVVNMLDRTSKNYCNNAKMSWLSPDGQWIYCKNHLDGARQILGNEFDVIYAYDKVMRRGYMRVVVLDNILYYQVNPQIPATHTQVVTMEDCCNTHGYTLEHDPLPIEVK